MYGTYCRLNVHVGASNRQVIKAFAQRMLRVEAMTRAWRKQRHAAYRAILREHANAQRLVRDFRL